MSEKESVPSSGLQQVNIGHEINSHLSFPIYVLLDLDTLSASMEITYSVHVVLRVRFADRRNFPFSTSKAA